MQFRKMKVLLLVLVFAFGHVRGEENYDTPVDDGANSVVDDNDEAIADEAGGFGSGIPETGAKALSGDGGDVLEADDDQVEDAAQPGIAEIGANALSGDASDVIEADNVQLEDKPFVNKFINNCPPGTHFAVGCNICYCYEGNAQGCTNIDCSKQAKQKLLSNPKKRLAFKRLRDHATGCVPGEKIQHEDCECNCAVPSVLTCPENCLS